MIPLSVFLLACAAVYLGAIEAAFSALMRLSLRLAAERTNRPGGLGTYLDDPLLLFIPVRLLLGLGHRRGHGAAGAAIGIHDARTAPIVALSFAAFVLFFELLLPLVIVGRDPERILELLLPTFAPIARALGPMTRWIARTVPSDAPRRRPDPGRSRRRSERGGEGLHRHRGPRRGHQERGAAAAPEHRRLRRHAGPRGDDAASRHRRDPRHRQRRRRPRAVPRAGIFALSGLQGLARQHRRIRLRQGSRSRSAATMTAGRSSAAAAGGGRPGNQARPRAPEAVPAPADAVRHRRRRVRRHRRASSPSRICSRRSSARSATSTTSSPSRSSTRAAAATSSAAR